MVSTPPDDSKPPEAVTQLLARVKHGDGTAVEQLLPLVYAELRGLAQAVFSGQRQGHTLQPTALVNEAWLKLAGNMASIADRPHFLAVAGKAMRQVIVDHARGKGRDKRAGSRQRVTLDTDLAPANANRTVDLVDLDDSLRRLGEMNERHARVAELRLFSGLTLPEVATLLGLSLRSIESDWAMARAWLRTEMASGQ